jgi:hypothetical protein
MHHCHPAGNNGLHLTANSVNFMRKMTAIQSPVAAGDAGR